MSQQSQAAERIGAALADAGLPRSSSRVFGALLADEDGRMTAAELADLLGVSAGSVSAAVTYLTRAGMIRRERERGSRRDVYVVDDDAWWGAMSQHDRVYAPIRSAFAQACDLLGDSPASARLALSLDFLRFLEKELDGVLERWEQHRRERGLPAKREAD